MTNQRRRRRSDSTEGRRQALEAAAQGEIQPPPHVTLREADTPFWKAIVRGRAREVWTDADLVHAGNLARSMADVERLQAELQAEGDVVETATGTPIANPKHKLVDTLSRRCVALSRLLLLSPRAASANASRDEARAKRAEDQARQDDDDDLIPRAKTIQ